MTVTEKKYKQKRYEILTQTVVGSPLVASGHHRRDTHMVMARYTYVHISQPPCRDNNDLHIPEGSHSDYATRETHNSTESHYYEGITQIVSNPYLKQIRVTFKKYQKSMMLELNTDGRKSPSSSLRPPPARHMVLAPFTYAHIPPTASRDNNNLHLPAGPHSEYGNGETHTSQYRKTLSHMYHTDRI